MRNKNSCILLLQNLPSFLWKSLGNNFIFHNIRVISTTTFLTFGFIKIRTTLKNIKN